MEILQVVGYSNSGKTTTVKALLGYISQENIAVASLKHHGHSGTPEGFDQKDSSIHYQAGAFLSGVEGSGLLQLQQKEDWSLEKIIRIYKIFEIEFLLIEGYKNERYPKIVQVDKNEDIHLLNETTNVIAAVSDLPINVSEKKLPVFNRNELPALCKWVLERYVRKLR